MRICFFIDDITHTGGIERVTSNLSQQFLVDRNDLVIDIVSQFKSDDKPWYCFDGCNLVYLTNKNYDAKPHSLQRLVRMIGNIWNVRQYFKNNKYDVIIGQSFPNVFVLFIAGVRLTSVLAAEHVFYGYYGRFLRGVRIFIYRFCKKIIVLTSDDKECYDRHFKKEHTVLIPNPVVVPEYNYSLLNNKQSIAMGRIQYQKGFDTLVDVYSMVHKKYPDWIVNIYGDGNYRKEISDLISQKGLEGVVVLKGRTNDVPTVMKEASFFILSSRFEGFGMVIVEAMCQGLPVVSFDCPTGPSDIVITNYNGILVKNQDKEALAEAIIYMIENPERRKEMGKNAVETAKKYKVTSIARLWYNLF